MTFSPSRKIILTTCRSLARFIMGRARSLCRQRATPENARKEQAIFRELVQRVPKETAVSNNTAESIIAVANHMIEGELLIAEGKLDAGLEELRAALTLEDALKSRRASVLDDSVATHDRCEPDARRAIRRGRASLSR